MAEGKERYQDYKTDKADGQVNWAQQGKDAIKDWKAPVSQLSCIWLARCHICWLQHCMPWRPAAGYQ